MTFLRRVTTLTMLLLALGAPARASALYDFHWDVTDLSVPAGLYAFTFEVPDLLTASTTIGAPALLAASDHPDAFIVSVGVSTPLSFPTVFMNFSGASHFRSALVPGAAHSLPPGYTRRARPTIPL